MSVDNDDSLTSKEELRDVQADHRMRMRFEWTDLIEELIQDGQDRGAFDDLKGKGKPLNLGRSRLGSEWELAHNLMKENDVLPPWIAKRNRIKGRIEEFRADMEQVWARYEQAFRYAQGQGNRMALSNGWDDACHKWEKDLQAINKEIADFNLGRPSVGVEMFKLRLDRELDRAGARRWLLDG